MISLFTPTHDARYLGAAHDSLLAQVGAPAWEWVIVPNGNAVEMPAAVRDDPRVRIVPAPAGLEREGVGALKRFACQHCRGDILFELGLMYATGRDCDVDVVAAHKWFNIAAIKGSSRAAELRAELSSAMTKPELVKALRDAREWMTAH